VFSKILFACVYIAFANALILLLLTTIVSPSRFKSKLVLDSEATSCATERGILNSFPSTSIFIVSLVAFKELRKP